MQVSNSHYSRIRIPKVELKWRMWQTVRSQKRHVKAVELTWEKNKLGKG